ncbi:glycosyltransferase family A protein [Chryseobacterium sp. JUb7]|uniref:glycosyltransferase family 2 protein n=1 Tax=Chryseobacterium sp. JUb7 TaxID=2940599 RepID=UPI00216A7797|nr:glycosyltransferase family A protein [Chryseobacterium sp. JUb7]MCS3530437.1 glycosyltransferase involved in cell wall biosynthesis [Chryseobacterium sp. JUb7]
MKKVSILIANYNNGKYFKACYDSLIAQKYENWEAIIVDDDSKDNSVEIIKDIIKDDPRFIFYKNEINQGCGFSKRKCAELATGDFYAYLDPDDALLPDSISRSLEEFDKNKDLIATYSQLFFCDENLKPDKIFDKIKQVHNNKYFFNCPIQISAFFVFKKEAYLKTSGINANLRTAVDQDLYLKLLEFGDAKFIKEPLYKYRLHSRGISQESSKQNAKDSFARVIYETMQRRGIKSINNNKVPDHYTNSEEIYSLLEYQTKPLFRLINKIKIIICA